MNMLGIDATGRDIEAYTPEPSPYVGAHDGTVNYGAAFISPQLGTPKSPSGEKELRSSRHGGDIYPVEENETKKRDTLPGEEKKVPDEEKRIPGEENKTKKRWGRSRILLVAGIAATVLVVVGLAVGLGVALSKSSSKDATSDTPLSSQTSGTPSPSQTSGTPSPQQTSGTQAIPSTVSGYPVIQFPVTTTGGGGAHAECPGADNSVYVTSFGTYEGASTANFLRVCERNYNGNDLKQVKALGFGDCMNACIGWNLQLRDEESACAGVTWNYTGVQGTGLNWCWLKSAMQNFSPDAVFVESAIILG